MPSILSFPSEQAVGVTVGVRSILLAFPPLTHDSHNLLIEEKGMLR
jgi:hypothetical protein